MGGLGEVAADLAEGHFDSAAILSNCAELRTELAGLREPAAARRDQLNLSLSFHEFNFDLARELEWIAEKVNIN